MVDLRPLSRFINEININKQCNISLYIKASDEGVKGAVCDFGEMWLIVESCSLIMKN